jgi:uncharacterized protein
VSLPPDLHRPEGPVRAAAIVLHPHPAMGGDRHHPLVVAVAEGLAARGVAALRPDVRDPDPRQAATAVAPLARLLAEEVGAERVVAVGYSWGAAVSVMTRVPGLAARVLVAPPVAVMDLPAGDEAPALVLVPAHDQYGGPDAVAEEVGGWPDTTIEVIPGADHFLVGAVARVAGRTVEWLVDQLDRGPAAPDGRGT